MFTFYFFPFLSFTLSLCFSPPFLCLLSFWICLYFLLSSFSLAFLSPPSFLSSSLFLPYLFCFFHLPFFLHACLAHHAVLNAALYALGKSVLYTALPHSPTDPHTRASPTLMELCRMAPQPHSPRRLQHLGVTDQRSVSLLRGG